MSHYCLVVCVSGYINTVDRDKFLVMAMEVTGDTYDTSLWRSAPRDSIMEHRWGPGHRSLLCLL